ncbi:MAG: DUF2946 domain-containing protein [Lautropia sp.]
MRSGVAGTTSRALSITRHAFVTLSRSFRRCLPALLGWLAIVGVAFANVAPTVSRVLYADEAALMAELCTSRAGVSPLLALAGTRTAASIGESGGADAPQPVVATDDCPYCTLAHHPFMPVVAVASLRLPEAPRLVPKAFLREGVKRHAWRTAQPRGPPAHVAQSAA